MKTISVFENLHRYIMDHKDADHKSAEAVIYGLIGENDELKKENNRLINENAGLITEVRNKNKAISSLNDQLSLVEEE